MKKIFFIFVFFFCIPLLFAQKNGKDLIDSLVQAASHLRDDTVKIKLLSKISFLYYGSDPDKGIEYGSEGLRLSEKLKWERGKSLCYNSIGVNFQYKSDYPRALDNYFKSLSINEQLRDVKGIANNLGNIGIVYSSQANYPKALEYFLKSLVINEETRNKREIVNNLGNISNIYQSQNDYNNALAYSLKALEACKGFGDSSCIADNMSGTGAIYAELRNYTQALKYLSEALRIEESLADKYGIAYCLDMLGNVYRYKGNDRKALEYYFKAAGNYKLLNNVSATAGVLGNIGICYHDLATSEIKGQGENLMRAIAYLDEAITLSKQVNSLNQIQVFSKALSEVQAQRGDYKNALKNYIQYNTIEDSVFSEQNNLKLANLYAQRDIDLKNKDIQIANKQLEVEKLREANKRNERNAYIMGICLLLVFIGILVRYYTQRYKSAKQKIENTEHKFRSLVEDSAELEAFSYSVSHDLRAPLRIINGYSEILGSGYNDKLDDEGKRLLNVIKANARRMGDLIEGLLNLSKIGKKALNIRNTDMGSMVNEVIQEQTALSDKHIQFNVGQLHPANCDSVLVRQVWSNFISNAVKYSSGREKPYIEINSVLQNDEIVYSVKDNGVGFDMAYKDKLFGVFQRLHSYSEFEGIGIGLALAQRIIAKHGGTVWAEAEIDNGATFYFSIPLKLPDEHSENLLAVHE